MIGCFYLGFIQRKDLLSEYDAIGRYVELIKISTNIALTIVHYFMAFFSKERYVKVLLSLQDVDKYILTKGCCKKIRGYCLKVVVMWVVLCLVQMGADMFYLFQGRAFFYWITYGIPYFIGGIIECRMVVNLNGLKRRFAVLNQILTKDIRRSVPFKQRVITIVKNTRFIHWSLVEVGRELNEIFSFEFLLMTANNFISIICSCYYLWNKNKTSERMSFFVFFGETYAMILITVKFILIVYNFTSIHRVVRT